MTEMAFILGLVKVKPIQRQHLSMTDMSFILGLVKVKLIQRQHLGMTKMSLVLGLVKVQVAQLDAPFDWRPGGRGFNPRRGRQHSFVEIDHEIFSTVILSLPVIQEGQLSVSGERMCIILVNRLED